MKEEDRIEVLNKIHEINNISYVEKDYKYLYEIYINGKNYEFLSKEEKDLNEKQRNEFIKKCNNIITLISSEGSKVSITWKQGFMSGFIKNIFLIDSEVTKIPLVKFNIDHETLIKIKDYLKCYENINPKEIIAEPLKSNNLRDYAEEWDNNYINLNDKGKLTAILSAASFLDINPLVNLAVPK